MSVFIVPIADQIRKAQDDGVEFRIDGDELKFRTPPGKEHWRDKIRSISAEIFEHLNGGPPPNGKPHPAIEKYKPFPIHTLPSPICDYVESAAGAIGCDCSFVALPTLAGLARAIGNRRVIRLKRTWTEPAIIWAAIVGKSGTHKTPAMQSALKFLAAKQAESIAKHKDDLAEFGQERAQYEKELAVWKKSRTEEKPPWEPEEPTCNRFTTSDCTIEALAMLLSKQFDGLLVTRDELASWLGGIGKYQGGKGADTGDWLSAWSAQPITIDRKSGLKKMIHVPHAAVGIVGGIQPGILRAAIGREHMQDGLCARLLMAKPESKPVTWTDDVVDPQIELAVSEVFSRLLDLDPAANEFGESEPFPIDLSPEARITWIDYYNRHRVELSDHDDDLAAAWSKLEAYTARFALIFQLVTWAGGDASAAASISDDSMLAAIELSDWFGSEAKRVYRLFTESEEDEAYRSLIEWIRRRGGRATARDLQRNLSKYGTSDLANEALEGLVKARYGRWEQVRPGPKGGQPTRVFLLTDAPTPTEHSGTA